MLSHQIQDRLGLVARGQDAQAGLGRAEALEYLDDPDSVLSKYSDPDEKQALVDALPTRHLLCLSQTSDSRLLAVGADDGFVILVDIRTQEVAEVIDVGGGRGESLAWMTVTADGAIVSLSVNSVMNRYRLDPALC